MYISALLSDLMTYTSSYTTQVHVLHYCVFILLS